MKAKIKYGTWHKIGETKTMAQGVKKAEKYRIAHPLNCTGTSVHLLSTGKYAVLIRKR